MTLINQRKCAFIVFLAFFMLLPFSTFAKISGSPGDVLAEVGSNKITRADFDREYKSFMKIANPQAIEHFSSAEGQKAFLGQLIELAVLMQKGEDLKLSATEEYAKLYEEAIVDQLAGEKLQDEINDVKLKSLKLKSSMKKINLSLQNPKVITFTRLRPIHSKTQKKPKKELTAENLSLKCQKKSQLMTQKTMAVTEDLSSLRI